MRYVIGIDQSTQGTKALLTDERGSLISRADLPHRQIVSPQGWVSHDPEEIYANTVAAVRKAVEGAGINPGDIAAVGISNQRETSLGWDRVTGEPADNAIVWQCARAQDIADQVTSRGENTAVRRATGLPVSPYFPAAKMGWLMKNSARAATLAQTGRLCLGTVDSWLVFRLTGGREFRTDYSNASRTQLFDIRSLMWSAPVCELFGVPPEALPEVTDSDGFFGETDFEGFLPHGVPIHAVMGDSHAALYGQGCLHPGMAKATYGTGSSVMMNIGDRYRESGSGLVTSLAWKRRGRADYVFEGNIHYTGAVIAWMQKDLGLIKTAAESGELAAKANRLDGTYLVPAFTGLGAPYWDSGAKAVFCGMSRTTGRRELVKAGLECIAYQITDVIDAMRTDSGIAVNELRVDGGASGNDYLMRFQSDIAGVRITVPAVEELSGIGAACMAGESAGLFRSDFSMTPTVRRSYEPEMDPELRKEKYAGWKAAVLRSRSTDENVKGRD